MESGESEIRTVANSHASKDAAAELNPLALFVIIKVISGTWHSV